MGTHPSGPALLEGTDTFLLDWLKDKPEAIGTVPNGYPKNDLPFMFKVLSIQTALSIQAHPDKVLANELHNNFPTIYKDNNHKPEMAIALTPFEALSGFRSVENIKQHLIDYPELRFTYYTYYQ
jgi:mannose-6-phosphate isomerase